MGGGRVLVSLYEKYEKKFALNTKIIIYQYLYVNSFFLFVHFYHFSIRNAFSSPQLIAYAIRITPKHFLSSCYSFSQYINSFFFSCVSCLTFTNRHIKMDPYKSLIESNLSILLNYVVRCFFVVVVARYWRGFGCV